MKLNIGTRRYPGFLNVGCFDDENTDYIFKPDVDEWSMPDNSVEEVIAHHVLEHIGDGFMHFMQELYRVCKNGAVIHIRVPHYRHETFYADPTHKRAITSDTFRMMSKKQNILAKEKSLNTSRLADLYNIDFEVLKDEMIPDDRFRNMFNNVSAAEAETYILQHWNIILELYIQITVVKEHD